MSEDPSKQLENNDKEQKNERFIALARSLAKAKRVFRFPALIQNPTQIRNLQKRNPQATRPP